MDPEFNDSRGSKLVQSKYNAPQTNLYFSSFCCYMGVLSFGFVIGFSSPALPQMEADGLFGKDQSSWFGSLMLIGGLIGSPIGGYTVDKLGRKTTILLAALPYLIGWTLIAFMSTPTAMYAGRLLTGIASGLALVGCPSYIAETSTKELRGMLGSGIQLAITVGILMAYLFGSYMTWSSLAQVGILMAIITIILTLRIPESPRYLLSNNKKDLAIKALQFLRGAYSDVTEECADMEDSLDSSSDNTMSWAEFCSKKECVRPLVVSTGLMFFQQLTGINVVMAFTVSIFKSAGYGENANNATVVIGVVQVLVTVVACYLMDRAGRRLLLLIAALGMAISCFSMGYYYHLALDPTTVQAMSWLALTSLVFYISFFSLGWGPVPALIMSEIFPVKARGRAGAITICVNWITGFIVTKEFDYIQETFGQHGAFVLYGLACVISLAFVWKLVPETKGKSLEDIELYFLGKGY